MTFRAKSTAPLTIAFDYCGVSTNARSNAIPYVPRRSHEKPCDFFCFFFSIHMCRGNFLAIFVFFIRFSKLNKNIIENDAFISVNANPLDQRILLSMYMFYSWKDQQRYITYYFWKCIGVFQFTMRMSNKLMILLYKIYSHMYVSTYWLAWNIVRQFVSNHSNKTNVKCL